MRVPVACKATSREERPRGQRDDCEDLTACRALRLRSEATRSYRDGSDRGVEREGISVLAFQPRSALLRTAGLTPSHSEDYYFFLVPLLPSLGCSGAVLRCSLSAPGRPVPPHGAGGAPAAARPGLRPPGGAGPALPGHRIGGDPSSAAEPRARSAAPGGGKPRSSRRPRPEGLPRPNAGRSAPRRHCFWAGAGDVISALQALRNATSPPATPL